MVRGGSEEGKIGGNFEKKLQKYSELLERDVKGVGEFFSNLGYSEAAKKFIENKIEGRLLPGLTTDHLVHMIQKSQKTRCHLTFIGTLYFFKD